MGTNFYMSTKNKELAEKYAPYSYMLTDTPDWGYEIHLAKTSAGWLPLFQAYKNGIYSVVDIKEAYDTGEFVLYDEYGDTYNWDQFTERVLEFNGGKLGGIKPEKVKPLTKEEYNRFGDDNMPDYLPVSHLPGNCQSYKYRYGSNDTIFADPEGYEFERSDFS